MKRKTIAFQKKYDVLYGYDVIAYSERESEQQCLNPNPASHLTNVTMVRMTMNWMGSADSMPWCSIKLCFIHRGAPQPMEWEAVVFHPSIFSTFFLDHKHAPLCSALCVTKKKILNPRDPSPHFKWQLCLLRKLWFTSIFLKADPLSTQNAYTPMTLGVSEVWRAW